MGPFDRQRQDAGDHATQIQAQTVVLGIDEKRAREIFREEATEALDRLTAEAQRVGHERAAAFEELLIDRLSASEGFDSFADPGFQVLLTKAQLGAAQTDDPNDYELLTSILAERAKVGDVRKRRISLEKAVEVVDKIDMDALTAISVIWLLSRVTPGSGALSQVLPIQNKTLEILIGQRELPEGRDWMDHLDLLNLVRVSDAQKYKKFVDYYPHQYSAVLRNGLSLGSTEAAHFYAGFTLRGVNAPQVIPHELIPGHFRVLFDKVEKAAPTLAGSGVYENQLESAVEYLRRSLEEGPLSARPDLAPALMEHASHHPTILQVQTWWDALPHYVSMTEVGVILARAHCEQQGIAERVNNWERLYE